MPQGDVVADELDNPLASVPEEAVYILGEETCQTIEEGVANLEELSELASTPDPFKDNARPGSVDLSSLKPEHAEIVKNYGSNSRPFKNLGPRSAHKFSKKLTRKLPGLQDDMRDQCDHAEYCLDQLEEDVATTVEKIHGNNVEGSAVDILSTAMADIEDTAQRVPSKASYQTVENAYLAAIAGLEFAGSDLAQRSPLGIYLGRPPITTLATIETLKLELSEYQEVEGTIHGLNKRGTRYFEDITRTVGTEQLLEATNLFLEVDRAKRMLPTAEQLEEDDKEAVLATESYLTGQVETVVAAIRRTAPEILEQKAVKDNLRRLRTPNLATELQEQEIQKRRAEVGEDVIGGITHAKNVLRGGGRLAPPEGQTEKDIKQKSQDLHALRDEDDERLLEREESGVIMATLTGQFDRFRKVVEKVKLHTSNGNAEAFPADKAKAISEIKGFDLEEALRKISGILKDSDRSSIINKVLNPEEAKRLKVKIEEVLEPEDPQAD